MDNNGSTILIIGGNNKEVLNCRKKFAYRPGDFPKAEAFYSKEVSFPIYPLLTDEEAGAVTATLISTLGCASDKTCSLRAVDRACL